MNTATLPRRGDNTVATLIASVVALLVAFVSVPHAARAQADAPLPGTPRGAVVLPEPYRGAGVLRIGTEANYPPFEFVRDGALQGFDIEMGNALGEELGVRVEWVNMGWDGLLPALNGRKIDLIVSGMTISEERKKGPEGRAFTRPYFLSGQVIARLRGNEKIASFDDLRAPGRVVAVQLGTTGQDAALEAGVPTEQVRKFSDLPTALLDVRNGKADAAVADAPAIKYNISHGYGELEVAPRGVLATEYVGVAARKNDLALVHALNRALDRLMVNGTYARLYEKWIGEPPTTSLLAELEKARAVGTTIPDAVVKAAAASPERSSEGAGATAAPTSALAIQPSVLREALPILLRGALVTLKLTALALLFGVPLGLIVALMRLSGLAPVRLLATWYVEVVRGTPLLMQIFVLYYVLGTPEVGLNLPAFWAGVVALSLNAAAYVSEIFRAGIQSIDVGQAEAARSLGMTYGQTMRYVILPQTLRRVLPPLTNEAVALLKDSSLVSVVAVAELMQEGRLLAPVAGSATTVYLAVALLYLAMTLPLTALVRTLENRWQPVSGRGRKPRGTGGGPPKPATATAAAPAAAGAPPKP